MARSLTEQFYGHTLKFCTPEEQNEFHRFYRTAQYHEKHEDNKTKQRLDKRQQRIKVMEAAGHRLECYDCGYSKCLSALEFHHPEQDGEDSTVMSKTCFAEQVAEAKRCIVLCCNCHKQEHVEQLSRGNVGRPATFPQDPRFQAFFALYLKLKPKKGVIPPLDSPITFRLASIHAHRHANQTRKSAQAL